MSLINDALRQAHAAQEPIQRKESTGPGPLMRPVEPVARKSVWTLGLLLPAVLAVIALVALFFAWRFSQAAESLKVRAVSPETVATTPASEPAAPAQTETVSAPTPAPAVASAPAPAASLPPKPLAAAVPTVASVLPATAATATDTNTAAVAAAAPAAPLPPPVPEPPKLPPLKLQAISYSKRPCAMINGRTVFLGDRVGDLRVAAIGPESATLIGGGRTNVLTLPQ